MKHDPDKPITPSVCVRTTDCVTRTYWNEGMTLREHFTCEAMKALIRRSSSLEDYDLLGRHAAAYADSTIRALSNE